MRDELDPASGSDSEGAAESHMMGADEFGSSFSCSELEVNTRKYKKTSYEAAEPTQSSRESASSAHPTD